MIGSNQRSFLLGLVENLPTLLFFAVLHGADDLRLAGWSAVLAAGAMLLLFARLRVRSHPILLGVNLYLLVITPLIETIDALGLTTQADFMVAHSRIGVLLAIFLVGGALTAFARDGFIGVQGLSKAATRRLSLWLLAASGVAMIWAASFEGDRMLAIILPLAALFGVRRFLLSGLRDRQDGADLPGVAASIAAGGDAGPEAMA